MVTIDLKKSTYLGDAVYFCPSDWETGGFWLFTHNGITMPDKIYLEPQVWESLKRQMSTVDENI